MNTLSLKALKEENAALEEKPVEEVETPEIDAEADALEEHIESTDDVDKPVDNADEDDVKKDDEPKDEVEEWLKTGDEDDNKEDKPDIDNGVARSIRLRATAKAERKSNAEIERLQAENERLRTAQPASDTTGLQTPNRDDYLDKDDPDTAYLNALSEFNTNKQIASITASQQVEDQKRQQAAQKQVIESNVNKHYDAAAKLIEGSNISEDSLRSADLNVRRMVEDLYPDAGDALVDAFISKVGAGSERVFFNLGINKTRLNQFRETLVNDPTGLDAAIFLGGLNKELNKAGKRKSSAPAPAQHVQGDAGASVTSKERALKKKYAEADKKGNAQESYNARKAGRAAGYDVSKW